MYVCMYVCMYACMYVYTCKYLDIIYGKAGPLMYVDLYFKKIVRTARLTGADVFQKAVRRVPATVFQCFFTSVNII